MTSPAQHLFEAYSRSTKGFAHDNRPIPSWDAIAQATPAVITAWEAAHAAMHAAASSGQHDPVILGELGFDAYSASTGGKTWSGAAIPPYATIRATKPHVCHAWEAAASDLLQRALERPTVTP